MSGYDSKRFASEFSRRTEENLDYISKAVNKDELLLKYQKSFMDKYQKSIEEIIAVEKNIREDINQIPKAQANGKNEIKRKMYSIADKLSKARIELEKELGGLVSVEKIQEKPLNEVTQLLNSLMGIAVLPYEVYKDILEDKEKDEKKRKRNQELCKVLQECEEYRILNGYIFTLYRAGKWKSTYNKDVDTEGYLKEKYIVFRFLKHLRNTVCHSGDNAISILPLTGETEITDILFYDRDERTGEEFAMSLSVKELEKLVSHIAKFYRDTEISEIDKAASIQQTEEKIKELLKIEIKQ